MTDNIHATVFSANLSSSKKISHLTSLFVNCFAGVFRLAVDIGEYQNWSKCFVRNCVHAESPGSRTKKEVAKLLLSAVVPRTWCWLLLMPRTWCWLTYLTCCQAEMFILIWTIYERPVRFL